MCNRAGQYHAFPCDVRNVSTTKDVANFKFTLFLSIKTTKSPKVVKGRKKKKKLTLRVQSLQSIIAACSFNIKSQ